MSKFLLAAVIAGLGALVAGCAAPKARPTAVPMPTLVDPAPAAAADDRKVLLVLMPGIREVPTDLVRAGFVEAVRRRGIAAEVVIPDAHIGYFRERSFIERLRADVLAPARARGFDTIWLAGISLGGFGSLLYASQAPIDEVDGLVVLAPYLGNDRLVAEVAAAGSLAAWDPGVPGPGDAERRLLAWLQGYGDAGRERPALWLGYGTADRFAPMNAQLARLLPAEHVVTVPGGHTWGPWTMLWDRLLDRMPLPRVADAQGPRDGGPRARGPREGAPRAGG